MPRAAAVEQMKRTGARILGVVLNRIPQNDLYYYTGYHYYHLPYYSTKKVKQRILNLKNLNWQTPASKKTIVKHEVNAKQILSSFLNVITFGSMHHRRKKAKLNSPFDWSYRKAVPSTRNQSVWAVSPKATVGTPIGEDEKSRKSL